MQWLDIKGAADYAGVSVRTIRQWMKDDLKASRPSHKIVRIRSDWIDDYLERFTEDIDIDQITKEFIS